MSVFASLETSTKTRTRGQDRDKWVHSRKDEPVLGVRDEDTSIGGTLHGTEDSVSGRGSPETNIEEALERSGSVLLVELLGHDESSIGLGDTLVLVLKTELGKGSSGAKETGGVG